MVRAIITTLVLLIATVVITVVYFKNLNPAGQQSGQVMKAIPADAALIFEFKNDQSFYDIFDNNSLLTTLIGDQKSQELNDLKNALLQNEQLKMLFDGQSVFISLHPGKQNNDLDFLITTASSYNISKYMNKVAADQSSGMFIHDMTFSGKPGYNIYLNHVKKRFYVVLNNDNTFSASFSQQLVQRASSYHDEKHDQVFMQLSDQQNTNSIANLYVNYLQLTPLFDQLFKNQNTDLFRNFRMMAAFGAMSLNYKNDALMFNGMSRLEQQTPKSYLELFKTQQPADNKLRFILPANTAYCMSFALSNPQSFTNNLLQWQTVTGMVADKKYLFFKIKKETGVDIGTEFLNLLGNEFAVITTRLQEKVGIVQLKNGMQLKPFMANMSAMNNDDVGQLKYDKVPLYLLGDAFSVFRRPYVTVVDNYLIFCNSQSGLTQYIKNYTDGKFLSSNDQYRDFNNLQAAKSNVSFFIHFANAEPLLKEALKPEYALGFGNAHSGWSNYYAAAYQLSASENNFYTNFYMRMNQPDTLQTTAKHHLKLTDTDATKK
jgi:hypothetical protein